MQAIIDADPHVSESEEMWAMFDKEMYGRRPVLLSLPDDTLYGNWNKTWLIGRSLYRLLNRLASIKPLRR